MQFCLRALEDLEGAHKPLTKLTYSCKMQVAGTQQHPVPNLMLLVPVIAVKYLFWYSCAFNI